MDRFVSFADGFEWLRQHSRGWQFGEQGFIDALIARYEEVSKGIMFPRVAVEIGAGDGESLPLTFDSLIASGWHVIGYEANGENQRKLHAKYHNNLVVRGQFKDGFQLRLDQPQVVSIDVDGSDYPIMQAVLQNCSPQILMVEHYDLAGPSVSLSANEDAEQCPPRWMLGMKLFNEFAIQAKAEALDKLAGTFGYVSVMRTRINSIFLPVAFAALAAKQSSVNTEVACG